jgi:hypothetical protein
VDTLDGKVIEHIKDIGKPGFGGVDVSGRSRRETLPTCIDAQYPEAIGQQWHPGAKESTVSSQPRVQQDNLGRWITPWLGKVVEHVMEQGPDR